MQRKDKISSWAGPAWAELSSKMAGVCAEHAAADCWALASPRRTQNLQKNRHAWVFLGKRQRVNRIPSHFPNKNSEKYIKIMQWLPNSSFSRWFRLHFSWFSVLSLSLQCSYNIVTEHLLHSMMKFYIFVLLAVYT